jgi:hypothetical protein
MVSQQGEVAIADQVISSATFFCLNLWEKGPFYDSIPTSIIWNIC